MAGLPWYHLWTDFPVHPKTLALCAALRDDNAGMYVIRLFSHCANHALDGILQGGIVEGAAGWRKKRGALLAALVASGVLEARDGDRFEVHGWVERNGARIRKAIADAAKPRGNRPRPSTVPRGTDAGPERDDGGKRAGPPREVRGEMGDREKTSSSLRSEGAPPAAPPDAAGSGAGGGERPASPPPAASPPAPKSDFAIAVEHWFTAWERAGRGKHARLTEAEGKQLKTLLGELGLAETTARMDRALADRWFLEHGDLLAFVKQRNKFAKPGAPANAREAAQRREDLVARREAAIVREASTCEAAAATLRVLATKIRPDLFDKWLADLRGELRGQVLEFTAPDAYAAAFVADQYQDLLVQAARAANGDGLHVQVIGPRGAAGAEA
jgi:hypothetical protein